MIELLTRRRMVTLIILLITLCVVVVLIEDLIADHETAYVEHYRRQSNNSHNTAHHSDAVKKPPNKKPSLAPAEEHKSPLAVPFVPVGHCWEKESFKVVDECRVCFRAEASLPACLSTGYREHVLCNLSGDSFRSCHAPMRGFWYIELIMLGLAWFFNAQVRAKQEQINKDVKERLAKVDSNV